MNEFNVTEANLYARTALFGFLKSISNGGTVSANKEPTGYFDSLEELICMWFDDFWRPENLQKNNTFSNGEFEILKRFSTIFDEQYPRGTVLPEGDINKLQNDPKWLCVVDAAKVAVKELGE